MAVDPETKPVEVELEAPEGCSGADAFFNTLRSRTARVRRAEVSEAHATLQVRLTRTRGHVMGELRIVDDHGGTDTRRVQGESCSDVVQALSLTAALALDPNALLSIPSTTSALANSEPPASAAETTSTVSGKSIVATAAANTVMSPPQASYPPASSPSVEATQNGVPALPASPKPTETVEEPSVRTSRPAPTFEFGVGTLAMGLVAGSLSPGFSVGARFTLAGGEALRTTLGLAAGYVRNDLLTPAENAQVALASLAGTLCPLRWTVRLLTFQPCALLLAGRLSASGRQVAHRYDVAHLWLSAGAGLRTAAYLARGLSVELEAALSVPVFKREFYSTMPSNVVAATPTLSPLVGIGLTYGL